MASREEILANFQVSWNHQHLPFFARFSIGVYSELAKIVNVLNNGTADSTGMKQRNYLFAPFYQWLQSFAWLSSTIVNFIHLQACTGIEDLEVAILQLEESNWNLTVSIWYFDLCNYTEINVFFMFQDAVNKAIPSSNPEPERPAPISTASSTPETPTFNPFSSSRSSGSPQQRASPPILVDDSPTAPSVSFPSKF